MNIREFVEKFDFENLKWDNLPENWPNVLLCGLNSGQAGKLAAIKSLWEISRPEKSVQRSRVWTDPEGYKFLVQWSNAVLLRYLVRKFTGGLPKSEYRRKAQIDDAARSVVRNIEEGYKRATTKEYVDFLGFSQGSLEEVKGDIVELAQDKFLKSEKGFLLSNLGMDLAEFHGKLKEVKGFYRNLEEVYPVLQKIGPVDMTVEIFLELINKTDFLMRKLVSALEAKQNKEKKFYQVEQARIREKFKGK